MYSLGVIQGYDTLSNFYEHSIWGTLWFKLVVMITVAILVILPLNLLKEINKLRHSSMLGVLSLVVLMLIILIELNSYLDHYWKNIYKENDDSSHFNWLSFSGGFNRDMIFFKATASMYYSFCCHLGAFPVYEKILKRDDRRTEKIFVRSILLDGLVYLIIGVSGYFTQPLHTPDMIIEREKLPGSSDIGMIIGRLLIVLMFLAKVPATYTCMRISIFSLLWKTDEISDKR